MKQSNIITPSIIVIFGITGDLAKKKILPAIYHIVKDDLFPKETMVLGLTRQNLKAKDILGNVELCVNEVDGICDPVALAKVKNKLDVLQIDISKMGEFKKLKSALEAADKKAGMSLNRLYYMSVPPKVTESIVGELGKHGLNGGNSRLLIEKPFGYDFLSAKSLIKVIAQHFSEEQIFRIDHYLDKETVENILVFRRHNIFERIWDGKNISDITISAYEKIDIEGRKVFYEETGALRDFIQSHLFMLLAVITLDIPEKIDGPFVHKAKLKALSSISPIQNSDIKNNTVRGQYVGYKTEVGNPKSNTETYAALKLNISTKRWNKVNFIIKTGKALSSKHTNIEIKFRPNIKGQDFNSLVFRLQPHEDIKLNLLIKEPGFGDKTRVANLDLNYKEENVDVTHPDAYERVLIDAIKDDHSLFSTSDEILASWRIVDNLIKEWTNNGNNLEFYKKGSKEPNIEKLSS